MLFQGSFNGRAVFDQGVLRDSPGKRVLQAFMREEIVEGIVIG